MSVDTLRALAAEHERLARLATPYTIAAEILAREAERLRRYAAELTPSNP